MPGREHPDAFDAAAVLGRLGADLLDGSRTAPRPSSAAARPAASGEDEQALAVPSFTDAEWGVLVGLARTERVRGLLAAAVSRGAVDVTDEQRFELGVQHREAMAAVLELERLLLDTAELLAANGIDCVVLKGAAVAHLLYPDPSMRDFGDVDLLLPAELLSRGVRVLVGAGATRAQVELAHGWDERFGKSVTLRSAAGYELDLHRTIAPGAFGLRGDPALLFARTQPLEIGGVRLRALSPEGQLLQACMHTAAGNRRVWLSSIADLVQLARSGRVDPSAFGRLVDAWGAAAVVVAAEREVAERMAGVVLDLLPGAAVDDHDRRRLRRYRGGFRGPALGAFGVLPARDWPAYARCLAWPSRENLRSRGLTRVTYLRRRLKL